MARELLIHMGMGATVGRCRTWVALAALAALIGCGEPTEGDLEQFCEARSYANERAPNQLDLLFVIDESPSMAAYADALVANLDVDAQVLETVAGGLPSVHVAVVSSDLDARGAQFEREPRVAGCSAPDGAFLIDQSEPWFRCSPDAGRCGLRNYDGDFAGAMACIGALRGEGAEDRRLLEAMRRALDGSVAGNAGFRRQDAWLAVVVVTDGDDTSGAPVAEYADFLTALDPAYRRVVVGVIAGEGSARLAALGDLLPSRVAFASIDDATWWAPIELLGELFKRDTATSCLHMVDATDLDLDEPGIQPACAATDHVAVAGSYAERVLPRCRMAAADRPAADTPLPCWWVADWGPDYGDCRLIPYVERAAATWSSADLRCVGTCD